MITILLASLFVSIATASDTSPLEEQWNLTINEKDDDYVTSIIESNYRGYLVSGTMGYSPINNDYDAFLYEIDPDGNLVWRKTFGGDSQDSFSAVMNDDQGYIAIGETISFGSPSARSTWMVKVDNDGNELWNKTIFPDSSTLINSGQKTSDGGFILAGMRAPIITAGGNLVALIIKTDSEGNVEWSKDYGSGRIRIYDCFDSVKETPDGGFILAGTTQSFSSGNLEDGWLVKVDSNGNELWNRSFGDKDMDFLKSVIVSKDGNYIAVGKSKQYDESLFNAWIVKTDQNGNLLWEERYFEDSDSSLYSIMATPDGNYLVAGSAGSVPNGSVKASFSVNDYKGVLTKINENGNDLWSETFDGYQKSSFFSITGSGNSYIVGGNAVSNESNGRDALMVSFNDPSMEPQSNLEDTPSDTSNEEKSPLSFMVTVVCLAAAFILMKKE